MRTSVVLFTFLASTSIAAAESYDATQPMPAKDTYLTVGASAGWTRTLTAGLQVDGGMRLGDTPLFAHGQIASGMSGGGEFQQARVGIETRGCRAQGWLCGFTGLDVGYQHDHAIYSVLVAEPYPQDPQDHEPGFPLFGGGATETREIDSHDLLGVPRIGVEAGRELRLRLALELPVYTSIDEKDAGVGVTATASLGYAF